VFGLFFRIFLSILLLGFEILLLARNLGCGSFGAYCFEILARVCVCDEFNCFGSLIGNDDFRYGEVLTELRYIALPFLLLLSG
jgi:hypothetical protein